MNPPIRALEYYLTKPGTFEERETIIKKIPKGSLLLAPIYIAICGSDLQYYKGEKSKAKLEKRLPLIPLHEGVCVNLQTREKVIPIAGDFRNVPPLYKGRQNIWPELPYLGATMKGLARTIFTYPKILTLPIPTSVPEELASLTEPLSIALKSIKEIYINTHDRIGIIGTGGMAYLLAVAIRKIAKVPKRNIVVFGINNTKLSIFDSLTTTFNYHERAIQSVSNSFHTIYEAVGRGHIEETMHAAMQLCMPGSSIGILGISDISTPLPTNYFVNTNITVKGLTRSTIPEYKEALDLLRDTSVRDLILKNLVNNKIFEINSAKNLREAFEYADSSRTIGRVLLHWPATL